jgi:hypothetical protein
MARISKSRLISMVFSTFWRANSLSRPALLTLSWVPETPPVFQRIWQTLPTRVVRLAAPSVPTRRRLQAGRWWRRRHRGSRSAIRGRSAWPDEPMLEMNGVSSGRHDRWCLPGPRGYRCWGAEPTEPMVLVGTVMVLCFLVQKQRDGVVDRRLRVEAVLRAGRPAVVGMTTCLGRMAGHGRHRGFGSRSGACGTPF